MACGGSLANLKRHFRYKVATDRWHHHTHCYIWLLASGSSHSSNGWEVTSPCLLLLRIIIVTFQIHGSNGLMTSPRSLLLRITLEMGGWHHRVTATVNLKCSFLWIRKWSVVCHDQGVSLNEHWLACQRLKKLVNYLLKRATMNKGKSFLL
jgi:hypothetical protein